MKKLILVFVCIFMTLLETFCNFPPDSKDIPSADFICCINGVTLYALKNQYVAMERGPLLAESPRMVWKKLNLRTCFLDRRFLRFPLCIDRRMTIVELVETIGLATGTAPLVLKNLREIGK